MSTPKVLVVDDNDQIRSLVTSTLADDFQTVEARDGEEAIAILTDQRDIVLVVLDVEMPNTNGWETLRIIRDEDGWPDTQVIMLTVHKEPENVLKAWTLGAQYYITKPFDPTVLLETVYRALVQYTEVDV